MHVCMLDRRPCSLFSSLTPSFPPFLLPFLPLNTCCASVLPKVWPDLISREYITLHASDNNGLPAPSSSPYDEI